MHGVDVIVVVGLVLLHPNAWAHALLSGIKPFAFRSQFTQHISTLTLRQYSLSTVTENQRATEGIHIANTRDSQQLIKGIVEHRGRIKPISSDMTAVQDFWGTNFEENISEADDADLVVDYDPFLNEQLEVVGVDSSTNLSTAAKSKSETDNTQEKLDRIAYRTGEGDYRGKVEIRRDDNPEDSFIRSAIAKSDLLYRSRITTNKASKDNKRSSQAKKQMNKSRRPTGMKKSSVAIARTLGAVRRAAAAVVTENSMISLEGGQSGGISNGNAEMSLTTDPIAPNLKSAIQSTVAEMLKFQETGNQQSDVTTSSQQQKRSPPPGTTSMGILGEVVQDIFPDIPPTPGTYLVRTIDGGTDSQLAIRSSIPHSSDDMHIANLRLSVFSRFDEEQQQLFRRQSIEVLNNRRKKGAVVLVAETLKGRTRIDHPYLNEMQSRIVHGHKYGEKRSYQHGQISSASSLASQTFFDVLSSQIEQGTIIGSVECSQQEFRGTILGNSRPQGSLMYVTEVAVRADARRCGAGAMLMRGVAEVAALRNIETIYLHVDVTNHAACAMYEKCGYHYLDRREPMYAQFTASLNLHDGAKLGRKHHLMCKNLGPRLTWR